jgi:hypothetical protein
VAGQIFNLECRVRLVQSAQSTDHPGEIKLSEFLVPQSTIQTYDQMRSRHVRIQSWTLRVARSLLVAVVGPRFVRRS